MNQVEIWKTSHDVDQLSHNRPVFQLPVLLTLLDTHSDMNLPSREADQFAPSYLLRRTFLLQRTHYHKVWSSRPLPVIQITLYHGEVFFTAASDDQLIIPITSLTSSVMQSRVLWFVWQQATWNATSPANGNHPKTV